MDRCYCANFYGYVNCRNTVPRFGDRCKLCLALKTGASMSAGLLPTEGLYMAPAAWWPPRRKDSPRTSNSTTSRSSRSATVASE